jgi:hypothetical protein
LRRRASAVSKPVDCAWGHLDRGLDKLDRQRQSAAVPHRWLRRRASAVSKPGDCAWGHLDRGLDKLDRQRQSAAGLTVG